MLCRGSARYALTFVTEAKELAEVAGSAYWVAKTQCAMAEINIALHEYEAATKEIEHASQVLGEMDGPEGAEVYRIIAHLQSKQVFADDDDGDEKLEEAEEAFEATRRLLSDLEGSFVVSDHLAGTPVKSLVSSARRTTFGSLDNTLLASTKVKSLMQQARMLRKSDRIAESNELLDQARSLQQGAMSIAGEQYIIGTTSFSAALDRFKADLFLNSVTESTISMPVGSTNDVDESIKQDRAAISVVLQDAESAFQHYISLQENTGDIGDVREAAVAIAMLRAYQASLGRNSVQYTQGAASLLGKHACR